MREMGMVAAEEGDVEAEVVAERARMRGGMGAEEWDGSGR